MKQISHTCVKVIEMMTKTNDERKQGFISPLLTGEGGGAICQSLKSNFAITLRHRKVRFCPWGFQTCGI